MVDTKKIKRPRGRPVGSGISDPVEAEAAATLRQARRIRLMVTDQINKLGEETATLKPDERIKLLTALSGLFKTQLQGLEVLKRCGPMTTGEGDLERLVGEEK